MASLAGLWSKPEEKSVEKKTPFSLHEEPIALSGDVEIVGKQIKESNKKLMYEVAVQYPQFAGGANPNFEKFNQLVRGSVTKKVAEFKKEMQPDEGDERKSTRLNSSHSQISYAVFCLKKKKKKKKKKK